MKKTFSHKFAKCTLIISLLATLQASAAWQPGLMSGSVTGSSINKTDWPATTETTCTIDKAATRTGWAQNTTYVYWGQIYFDGSTYRFGENIDDAVYLKIDDTVVLNDATWNTPTWGTITPTAGWHDFELRMFNGTGGAGPIPGSGFVSSIGFGYTNGPSTAVANLKSAATFAIPSDPGNASLLRYDDGKGWDDSLEITWDPVGVGNPTPPYGVVTNLQSGDTFSCSAPTTGSVAMVHYALSGYVLYDIDTETGTPTNTVATEAESSFTYTHNGHMRRLVWNWEKKLECRIAEPDNVKAIESATFTYTAFTDGTDIIDPIYVWTLEGTTSESVSGATATNYSRTLGPGEYTISLCVTNGDGRVFQADGTRTISVYATNIHVCGDGSETAPYNTPELGFKSLGAALEYAQDGQTILVADGTYAPASNTESLNVKNAVTIRSASGDRDSVIFAPVQSSDSIVLTYAWLAINNSGAVVRDMTFSNIWMRAPGGYATTHHIALNAGLLYNCKLTGLRSGGGAWQYNNSLYINGADAVADRCLVEGCYPETIHYFTGQAAVCIVNGVMRNSIIRNNRGYANNSVKLLKNTAKFYNNTVVDNTATFAMGGYLNYDLSNTLFAGWGCYSASKTADLGQNNVFMNNNTRYDYCGQMLDYRYVNGECLSRTYSDDPVGKEAITGDPIFRDPKHGDYRIMPGSCLIGAGTELPSVTNDFSGAKRGHGTLTVGAYDLADEFSCGMSFSAENNVMGTPIIFKGYVHDPNASEDFTYAWTITKNGDTTPSMTSSEQEFSTSELAPGRYAVRLCVTRSSDGTTTFFERSPDYLYVGPTNVYVNPYAENPLFPYCTTATATRSLEEAYDALVAPGIVHLAPGTNHISKTIMLDRPVTISGSGRDNTIVCQTGMAQRVFYIAHCDAVIEKIGISGGNRDGTSASTGYALSGFGSDSVRTLMPGGGVYISSVTNRAGSIRDCRLFGNSFRYQSGGKWYYGAGGQLAAAGGLVERCIIEGDGVPSASYGAGVWLGRNATLRNSLIKGNAATTGGAGVYVFWPGANIVNCTVTDNSVSNATALYASNGAGLYIAAAIDNHGGNTGLTNSIFWGNYPGVNVVLPESPSINTNSDFAVFQNQKAINKVRVANCLTSFEFPSAENDKRVYASDSISGDPKFRATGKLKCEIARMSPCVNAGISENWMDGATDINGNRRVAQGCVDIGCYEVEQGGTVLFIR